LLPSLFVLGLGAGVQSANAGTLYKCMSNGQITYANEPCKGQSVQVIKPNDTGGGVVQINGDRGNKTPASDVPDIPVVKLEPKSDSAGSSLPPNLAAEAAANAHNSGNTGNGSSTNERFLSQLQQQTQQLAAQAAGSLPPASAAAPALAASGAASGAAGLIDPMLFPAPPSAKDIMQEAQTQFNQNWRPALVRGLIEACVFILAFVLVILAGLYFLIRTAVKHGVRAAWDEERSAARSENRPQAREPA